MFKYSIFILLLHSTFSQTTDKYSDEDRPYKFGFNIQGYQHRQEEKNERGIIMGEYGFITADGYYRVTVYATDENGDFKILSMKNYYVGFPPEDPTTTPGPPGRSGPGPAKLSFGSQPASPGTGDVGVRGGQTQKPFTRPQGIAACSDCSIPTTTVRTNQFGGGGFGGNVGGGFGGSGGSGTGGFGGSGGSGSGGFRGSGGSGSGGFGGSGGSGSGGFGGSGGSTGGGFGGSGGSTGGGFGGSGGSTGGGFGGSGGSTGGGLGGSGGSGGGFPQGGQSGLGGQGGSGAGGNFGQGPTSGGGLGGQSPQEGLRSNIPQTSGGLGSGFGGNQGNRPGAFGSFDPNFPRRQNEIPQFGGAPPRRPQIGEVRDGLPPGVTINDIKDLLYTFNYTVGFHGHHEDGFRNGDKEGDYFFDGRDGVERKVEYIANEFGFQPNITLIDLPENDVRRPKEETEKEYGLKGYEFKWFYRR